MAPTWALPLPCLHPTQAHLSTAGTLPQLAGYRSLCSRWEGYGGWHSGPTVRAAMALQELAHTGSCRSPLANTALLSHGCAHH